MSHLSKYGYTVRRARARGLKPERCGRRRAAPVGAALTVAGAAKSSEASPDDCAARLPLMGRPYDFRHAGVSWRLNAGTLASLVAEWAGHTVEVLLRIYAHCIDGDDERWFGPMDDALGRD